MNIDGSMARRPWLIGPIMTITRAVVIKKYALRYFYSIKSVNTYIHIFIIVIIIINISHTICSQYLSFECNILFQLNSDILCFTEGIQSLNSVAESWGFEVYPEAQAVSSDNLLLCGSSMNADIERLAEENGETGINMLLRKWLKTK